MWTFSVVESTKLFAKNLGFFQGIEEPTIEKLSAHTSVEGYAYEQVHLAT